MPRDTEKNRKTNVMLQNFGRKEINFKVKVKQSRYRPGGAQRVPGS